MYVEMNSIYDTRMDRHTLRVLIYMYIIAGNH